ncbi:MAG: family 1 glycosylhydrolase [Clostridia bacterium]|nr:family 1 glycosylhydrolase [Clostridia bacterium]
MDKFNKDTFMWGVDDSAFQVEGAWNEDGKGESIWDRFCHDKRGKVYKDQNGDVACDQYHRYKEDMKMMGEFGIQAHRFSVSWPRVIPNGIGEVNPKGIQYYHNLIDEMIKNGVEPVLTMYHWDYPQELMYKGGWANEESVDWWMEYAEVLFREFAPKVKYWITYNEPYVFAIGGYAHGHFPPCIRDYKTALRAGHHAMRAHFKSIELLHKIRPDAKMGMALDMVPRVPATDKPEDIAIVPLANETAFYWFYNLMATGEYPSLAVAEYEKRGLMPEVTDEDRKLFHDNPNDFIGINYYSTCAIRYCEDDGMDGFHYAPVGRPQIINGYTEIDPEGLRNIIRKAHVDTKGQIPIMVTENGFGSKTEENLDENGEMHDTERIEYIQKHVDVVRDCRAEGIDVRGYFVWSFTDIFEWSCGTENRYGLIHVNYDKQKRTPKDSAYFYKKLIEEGI